MLAVVTDKLKTNINKMALTKKQLDFKKAVISELKERQGQRDYAKSHCIADGLLCDLLEQLDCKDVVEEFEKIGKWYS